MTTLASDEIKLRIFRALNVVLYDLFHCLVASECITAMRDVYSGRKITASLGNVTIRRGKDGKSKREHDCQQSV
jgi:hypothetical protein